MTEPIPVGARAIRIVPYGEAALLVSVGETAAIQTARWAQALVAQLADEPALVGRPAVAGLASVLVRFDPLSDDAAAVAALVGRAAGDIQHDPEPPGSAREHTIAVHYGGEDGPDLDDVAEHAGLKPAEVIDVHAATGYEVLMLGFAPGFAYLGEVPETLRIGRLATPRARVPAGSVGIAETLTGIYPAALPGGWRIIGRTNNVLFDPRRPDPATLRPGDRVRFVPAR